MSVTAQQRAELHAIMDAAETLAQEMLKAHRSGGAGFSELSPVASQMMQHLSRDKLAGLDVYCEGQGWFADLLLKDMPKYVTTRFGTPSHLPCATEEKARDEAVKLLAFTLLMIYTKDAAPAPSPEISSFSFFGQWLDLPRDALKLTEKIGAAFLTSGQHYDFSEPAIRSRLDQVKQHYFGDAEVTSAAFNALPDSAKHKIFTLIAIAATTGLIRHPPLGQHESIQCPRCGRVSYNPTDIKTQYCGACHKFHDDP